MKILKEVTLGLFRLIRDLARNRKELFSFLLIIAVCLLVFVLTLKVFAELTEDVLDKQMVNFDSWVSDKVLGNRSESLTRVMIFITHFGDRIVYSILTVLTALLLYWRKKTWTDAAEVVIVLLSAGLVNRTLKQVFEIQRPDRLYHLVEATSPSFPSGHAMGSMVFYGFLIYLCWRYIPWLVWRILITIVLGLLILLIGLSRIYLGVHYASDIIAGFVAGLLWLSLCIMIFQAVRFLWRRNSQRQKKSGLA